MSIQRLLYFAMLLVISWSVMVCVHEMGHIACGILAGGTLRSADLAPWRLPFSLFEPDPYPLVTLWGGPVLGVVLPIVIALMIGRDWGWFIANFCVLGNGVYIAAAWFSGDRFLDTPMLIQNGAHPISILIYCLATIGFGYLGFRKQCQILLFPPQSVA